ncbi:MAG: ArsR/SmtB family transcription factor [Alphaproteobacteria bacterium]
MAGDHGVVTVRPVAKHHDNTLSATFHALADPTRRAILAQLALGEERVSTLAEPFTMSLPAISKHLKVLEGAGLIRRTIDGRVHQCRLAPEPLEAATGWIEEHRKIWQQQFDRLARFLEQTSGPAAPDHSQEENT